jgi:FAD/FMN-containing dehydrogenase
MASGWEGVITYRQSWAGAVWPIKIIKRMIDPLGLMNPGKVSPLRFPLPL